MIGKQASKFKVECIFILVPSFMNRSIHIRNLLCMLTQFYYVLLFSHSIAQICAEQFICTLNLAKAMPTTSSSPTSDCDSLIGIFRPKYQPIRAFGFLKLSNLKPGNCQLSLSLQFSILSWKQG